MEWKLTFYSVDAICNRTFPATCNRIGTISLRADIVPKITRHLLSQASLMTTLCMQRFSFDQSIIQQRSQSLWTENTVVDSSEYDMIAAECLQDIDVVICKYLLI